MKKIFKVLSMLVLVCLVGIVLGSCNDNDQNNENPTTYKVTFYAGNSEDDEVLKQVEVESGQTVEEWTPANKEDGSTFVGWYATPSLTHEFDFSTPITKDTSIFSMWTSVAEDNNVWEIIGNLHGNTLGSSNWGSGNKDNEIFKLTKVEGKPNVFTGVFELYQEDEFQFAVLSFKDGVSKPDWLYQIGGGQLDQGENEWFELVPNYLDPTPWKANIKCLVDGRYEFTITTSLEVPSASKIEVERLGDVETVRTAFMPVIAGTLAAGDLLDVDKNADLVFPTGKIVDDKVIWEGKFSFNNGEKLNILMLNNWDLQLKSGNLDKEASDNVSLTAYNEIEILSSGEYNVKIEAPKEVASGSNSDMVYVNLDSYKDGNLYKVTINKEGVFKKTDGVVYDTFNVKYNGMGEDYQVYIRDGARFPTIINPSTEDGTGLMGWYYLQDEEKLPISYEKTYTATGKTYDLNAELINKDTKDVREFWIKGANTISVNGENVDWGTKTLLTQTGNTTYEIVLDVSAESEWILCVDYLGVTTGVYYRTSSIINPGDFLNLEAKDYNNIKFVRAGTYKLVLDSITCTMTIVEI